MAVNERNNAFGFKELYMPSSKPLPKDKALNKRFACGIPGGETGRRRTWSRPQKLIHSLYLAVLPDIPKEKELIGLLRKISLNKDASQNAG